jgi:hypothetical protein
MVLDTVIMIVSYDCHMFIVQATAESKLRYTSLSVPNTLAYFSTNVTNVMEQGIFYFYFL